MSDKTLQALRRRLDKWELEHLRRLAAELQERCERAEDEARRAWESAEWWQQSTMDLQHSLSGDGVILGMTVDGSLVVIPAGEEAAS